jgi:hypothetical protein
MEIKSIITNNFDVCYVCGKPRQQFHHIMNGAYRKKSEKYGLIIPICEKCHREVHDSPNQELNRKLKADAQATFMMEHTYAEWLREFGRNYL